MANPADLAAVEARLLAILEPYRDRLAEGEIYGVSMLRRPGAKAHDWFAGVRMGPGSVKFFLLTVHTHPKLLDGISPVLRKRKTGASVFTFAVVDESLFAELEALVARSFGVYAPGGAGSERS